MDFAMKDCGGCLSCEMACSYKHMGEFNPRISSIEIIENPDGPGYKVRLTDDPATGRRLCDACKDLDDEPMCMRYCHKRDDLKAIIDEFAGACRKEKAGGF